MAEKEVSTVFLISDQASGPLAKMAKGAVALEKSTERAKRSTLGVGMAPMPETERPTTPAPHAPMTEADLYKAVREESRARRMRTKGLRLEEQKGQILEHAMEQSGKSVV